MKNFYDKFKNYLKPQYLVGVLILLIILTCICVASICLKDKTVKCDNDKAIKQLKEQNIADIARAADNIMIQQNGDYYKIVFSDELSNDDQYDGEFAKLRDGSGAPEDIVKADYDKSQAFTESVDKEINKVACTIPVTFSNFSQKSRKSTLTGTVSYIIHANDKGNVKVDATSLENIFKSNLRPIYDKRQEKYLEFVYITADGDRIENLNDIPLQEFGDFFDPLDY